MRQAIWLGLCAAVFCAVTVSGSAPAAQNVSFDAPRVFAGGTNFNHIAVADFNGDGQPDLITADVLGFALLLGNKDGTFRSGFTYNMPSGDFLSTLAVGDFNRDGKQDLVITAANEVWIFLGNGDGTFQNPRTYFAGSGASFVVAGDFNGDGVPDLAVLCPLYNEVSVLTGRGDGSFGPPVIFPVGFSPNSAAVGDFNGDGKLDLAVADGGFGAKAPGEVAILLGNGDGTLRPFAKYGVGDFGSIVAGDFNGDGKLDIAVTQLDNLGLLILLGNGDGTFLMGADYKLSGAAGALVRGDFNGDGKPDLAVSSGQILLGNGDGTFHFGPPFQPYPVNALAVGYFNRDRVQDLAVAAYPGIVILLGSGQGTFQRVVTFPDPASPASVAVGDFNGDGNIDLAVSNIDQATVTIYLGDGHGSFQTGGSYSTGDYPYGLTAADFNQDGKLDLATVNWEGSISILLGNGDGSFRAGPTLAVGQTSYPSAAVAVDLNGDGKPDLVVNDGYENQLYIFLGNGDGTFQAPVLYNVPKLVSVATGDFNGDGIMDLALSTAPTSAGGLGLVIWLGNGDGTFAQGMTYGDILSGDLVAADLNGDHILDLVVSGPPALVLLGTGDGAFQPPLQMNFGGTALVVADFNGDGKPDLAFSGLSAGSWLGTGIALGRGDGTFSEPAYFAPVAVTPGSSPLAVAKLNGDGRNDLAVATGNTAVAILMNTTK
jgi:hypothetical protein